MNSGAMIRASRKTSVASNTFRGTIFNTHGRVHQGLTQTVAIGNRRLRTSGDTHGLNTFARHETHLNAF